MVARTPAWSGPDTGPPAGGSGVRLSGLVHLDFRERTQPLFAMDPALAGEIVRARGQADSDLERLRDATGNTFIAMSEALLARADGREQADLDAVLLAYEVPDLYHAGVAGCYLSQRLPGAPVPCSVAEQGPAAMFTALRIADGMCRLGELRNGALFCFDQNAPVWEHDDAVQARPDSAVLIGLGAGGDVDEADETDEVTVAELTEIRTGEPGDPTPRQALDRLLAAHPGVRVVIGQALAGELRAAGQPVPPGVEEAAPDHWCTGVWAVLAREWPVREAVLVADSYPVAGRVYGCLLVRETSALEES